MGGRNGKRHGGAGDALEMLDRCHQKICDKIDLLIDAAKRWSANRDREALEDATAVSDFLGRAGKRHSLDEEHSIFPRLDVEGDGESLIRVLRAEHRDHEREGAVLASLVSEPGGPDPEELTRCAERLASAYRAHVVLEDSRLMPLVRQLPPSVLGTIYDEMQARRGR